MDASLSVLRRGSVLFRRLQRIEVRFGSRSSDPDKPSESGTGAGAAETSTLDLAKPGRAKSRRAGPPLSRTERDALRDEEKGLDRNVVTAVDAVAGASRKGSKELRSDLLRKLQEQRVKSDGSLTAPDKPLVSSLLSGMKLERRTHLERDNGDVGDKTHRSSAGKLDSGGRVARHEIRHEQRSWDGTNLRLFDGPALGIFTKRSPSSDVDPPRRRSLFDLIEEEERQRLMTMPPNNAFEEMIRWTKEGKLWKFPIDNEQGLDDEAKVGFHEHVFLEPHLEGRFPKKGPIRHFMELVAIGLSKNPYFTAQEKREHIEWYAEYFKDKYHLIEEEASAALDKEQKKEIADSDSAREGKKQCVE